MSIPPRALTVFYFIAPMILAGLLDGVLELDISQFLKQYLGVLAGIEKGGFDIKFKSFNLLFLILFLPAIYIAISRTSTKNLSDIVDGSESTLKIIGLLMFVWLMLYLGVWVMYIQGFDLSIHNDKDPYEYIQPGARIFLMAVRSDILFGLFSAMMFSGFAGFIYGIMMFTATVLIRFLRLFKN